MKKIRRLKVFPFALFQAVLVGLIGVICGILYAFGGLLMDTLVSLNIFSPESMSTPGLSYGTLMAFGALAAMPVIGAFIGFLTGIVEALLYNLFARWFGGLKINFELRG